MTNSDIDPRLNGVVLPASGRVQVDVRILGKLHEERDVLRLALLQERERCAEASKGHAEQLLKYGLIDQANVVFNDADRIDALPDPCDLTNARKVMQDAKRWNEVVKRAWAYSMHGEYLITTQTAGPNYERGSLNAAHDFTKAIDAAISWRRNHD